jgi:hypothetical protein
VALRPRLSPGVPLSRCSYSAARFRACQSGGAPRKGVGGHHTAPVPSASSRLPRAEGFRFNLSGPGIHFCTFAR